MTAKPDRRIPTVEDILSDQKRVAAREYAERQAKLPAAATPAAPSATALPVTALTAIPDSARRYLDKNAGTIVGKALKLNGQTGAYSVGDGTEEIDLEAIYIAHCAQAEVGFVNFGEDGDQPKRVMVALFGGAESPERESLGDTDSEQWPLSQFGERRDPWVPQTTLVLQNLESNALYTLIVSSISARNAVDNLLRQYAFFPGEPPLVKLGVGKYLHKTRKTWIHYPTFHLHGRLKGAEPAQPAVEAKPDFQDEIPL
jgi:hypothetical protein